MATITTNDHAPDAEAVYSLPGAEFTLSPGGSYETDDRAVLNEAEVHPWLAVEYNAAEAAEPTFRPDSIPADEDALGAARSEAFDPEAIARDREAVLGDGKDHAGLAVDAGLDQGEPVNPTSDLATTLAGDDDFEDGDE